MLISVVFVMQRQLEAKMLRKESNTGGMQWCRTNDISINNYSYGNSIFLFYYTFDKIKWSCFLQYCMYYEIRGNIDNTPALANLSRR